METLITLYTTEPCGFCRNAKALLKSRGLAYNEISLAKDPVGRTELMERTGMMSFPQIIIGERTLGGFRELVEAERDGTLESLLAA
jgi:glutaredoxin 3